MRFYNRIRYKLLFGFILVALIPAVLIGFYSISVSSQSLLEQELNAQQQLVSGQRQSIESFLSTAKGDVSFLSESAPLKNFLAVRMQDPDSLGSKQARKALQQELLAFAKNRKIYYQVRYLDETGQEIVRVDTDSKGNGSIIAEDRLQNKAGRYYFKDAVDLPMGWTFVSPLDLNRERGQVEVPYKPVIRYAVPVQYPNNKRAGVVLTNIDAKGFLDNLGQTMLLDLDGYYLNHPKSEKTWGSKRDLGHEKNFNKDFEADAAEIMRRKQGSITTETDAISFQRISVSGSDAEWILVSRQPMDLLLESVNQFRITFMAVLVGALLIALIVALFLDAKITRPIEYLTEAAGKVSMGELLGEVKVSDKGEIGQLAEAFERMRVSMVRMMERMRRKATPKA